MIIPEQMQNAVDKELRETILELHAGLPGLPHRGVCRDDDVPEELGANPDKLSLLHGKRDDIGCPLAVQILSV